MVEKAQTQAFAAIFVITVYNILLGCLMVGRVIPVMTGMGLSFAGMGFICGLATMVLMPGEKPWRRPKKKSYDVPNNYDIGLKEEADYWNERMRKDGLG